MKNNWYDSLSWQSLHGLTRRVHEKEKKTMEKLTDGLKKILLAGIGTVAVTAENQKMFWMTW